MENTRVAIVGAGMTPFGRLETQGLMDLLSEASMSALESAAAIDKNIDSVFVGNMAAGELCDLCGIASTLADRLNLLPAGADRIENGPASGGSALRAGFATIRAGLADLVLVVGGEKMTHVPGPRVTSAVAAITHETAEKIYGVTLPSFAAMLARLYLDKYGYAMEDISAVAVKNHQNGSHNPFAHFQKEISLETALSSPVIADPLRLYDCCPVSDGAAAVVLASEATARELTPEPVFVTGSGQATDLQIVHERENPTFLTAVAASSQIALDMAGIQPSDIGVTELHDAFTILEILESEAVGFFPPGEGPRALVRGDTAVTGSCPINPSGGLKARGHPWGATGVAQAVEIFWQLRGAAGDRQVPNEPRFGMAVNFGGFGNNVVTHVFERGW
ncbi:MAG TPA: thiolase domain-containing protein [Candidatus Lokiarchaeia archaeon]|nr:thiolase domain-containing protein [Candidatus Lokiarchaeia archaeon]